MKLQEGRCSVIENKLLGLAHLIRLIEGEDQFRGWKTDGRVQGNLKIIFENLRLECVRLETHKDIVYRVVFRYAKMQEVQLTTVWQFLLSEQLEITVEMDDVHKQMAVAPSQLQVAQFLQELNRRVDGTFFSKSQTPYLLGFRHKLPYKSQYNYLARHITNIYKILSEQFIFYAIKLKLFPNIGQSQSDRIHKLFIQLNTIREAIELNRQKRQYHTALYNLSGSKIKSINEAMSLIGLNIGKLKEHKLNYHIQEKNIMKNYKGLQDKVKMQLSDEKLKKTERQIVWGIEIQKVVFERQHSKAGGYSLIITGQYLAALTPTIRSNQALSSQLLSCVKRGCFGLAKKIRKPRKLTEPEEYSFQNQQQFLKYVRGYKNRRIAQYYLLPQRYQASKEQIFLEIYPRNLYQLYASETVSMQRLLRITSQILQGIIFLWSNNILHRDLKEANIMIDNHGEPRIIDFGSSSGFYFNDPNQYRPFKNDLMSTKGYYFPYSEVKYQKILEYYSRDQYNRSPTFDVYSFGQIITNVFKLKQPLMHQIQSELIYLACKCQEINPADRPTPIQLCILLSTIKNLNNELTSTMKDERGNQQSKAKAEGG